MALENTSVTVAIDNEKLLEEYNDEMAKQMIPVMVFLSVLMIFGIIGNIAVSYYYGWKARRSSGSLFILTLSVYDLLLCTLSVPIEILDMRFFYIFKYGAACKFMRFINYFVSAGSIFTLQVIAVDRYRKICIPFKSQIGKRGAKIAWGLSILAGIFFSWAAPVIYNAEHVDIITSEGILLHGYDCTTLRDKSYNVYIWLTTVFYALALIISALILFTMYSLVGKTLFQHVKKARKVPENKLLSKCIHDKNDKTSDLGAVSDEPEILPPSNKQNDRAKPTTTVTTVESLSVTSVRFTYMMFAISAVYFLSFVPYIAFSVWRGTLTEYKGDNFSTSEQIGLNIGMRSYFLNSAINPFIYGLFNPKFRSICYRRVCLLCCKKSKTMTDTSLNGSSTQTSKLSSI